MTTRTKNNEAAKARDNKIEGRADRGGRYGEPFEIKVHIGYRVTLYEAISYPKDVHYISMAVARALACDFREYGHGLTSGIDVLNRFVVYVEDIKYLLTQSIVLEDLRVSQGSTKIQTTVVAALLVSGYNGIASYPDFKKGFSELIEDLEDISSFYDRLDFPSIPKENTNIESELFFRNEDDILEEIRKKIRKNKL